MRALTQGIDPRKAWDRYLQLEGESIDARRVRSTIAWIRNEFAAAAKREDRPGTARLVLWDISSVPDTPAAPSLDEFATANGLEDFSIAEQEAAYAEAFGGPTAKRSPRARLIERQLRALYWLEELVADDPRPGDGVGAWFASSLALRLEKAGIPTLFALVERINAIGMRWWASIPGIGATKGQRIQAWLVENSAALGLALGSHVAIKRSALTTVDLNVVVAAKTGLVPIEKFVLPEGLSGKSGRFRAPPQLCSLSATNDLQAIEAWLSSKRSGSHGAELTPTQRSYRKEAERLMLWSILERGLPISSLTAEDAIEFAAFLQSPPGSWCGPRHHERWSPLWRPLEGPLSASALRQAITVLRGLYTFLVAQNYTIANPFAAVAKPADRRKRLGSDRALSEDQWQFVENRLAAQGDSAHERRVRRAIQWLYATGLRQAEILAARCGDLEEVQPTKNGGGGWLLNVVGKGQRERQVPVPGVLVADLQTLLAQISRPGDTRAPTNANIPVLASFELGEEGLQPWSAAGLHKALKKFFAECARAADPFDASRLIRASTHWIRHTHGTHATARGMDVAIVRNNMGHASLATTSSYITTERDARIAAIEKFWAMRQPS